MNTHFEQTMPTQVKPLTIGEIVTKAKYKPSRIAIAGRLIFVYVDKPTGLNKPTLQSRFSRTPLTCVSFGWTQSEGHYFTLQLKSGVQVA